MSSFPSPKTCSKPSSTCVASKGCTLSYKGLCEAAPEGFPDPQGNLRSSPLPLEKSPSQVLIYRQGSLGDTLVALPCFHLIARSFPQAQRHLLTNFPVHAKAPAAAAVLGDSGLVHGYLRYTTGTRSPAELLRLALAIRRFKPDLLIYLMPVRAPKDAQRDARFFRYACGVKNILGLPQRDERDRILNSDTGMYEPESARLARMIADLGPAAPDIAENRSLLLTAEERARATQVLAPLGGQPFFVIGPGTKMQAKDWGQENWRALAAALGARYPGNGLALVGAPEEAETSDFVAQGWNGPSVNLCGKLSPRETAAVMEHARVFLGPDSGPMHLAASAGIPAVIAFSARGLPGVWFPAGTENRVIYHRTSCYGCNLETCVDQKRRCLSEISVEEMANAVESVLSLGR